MLSNNIEYCELLCDLLTLERVEGLKMNKSRNSNDNYKIWQSNIIIHL